MSDVTQLGHIHINGADELFVQLIRSEDLPAANGTARRAVVRIRWPLQPSIIDPKQFPDVAAGMVRMFAAARTEVASIRTRKRPL